MNRITAGDVKQYPEFKDQNDEQLNAIVELIQCYNNVVYQLAMGLEKTDTASGKLIEITTIKTQAA
ncbi:MAG TPA: hypothetical protein PKA77_09830 [Chitinophagaceae bacterium]|jgi:hypothetical protein|nr:hypothetical protein [Saprospiraceae bacterium]HMT74358.1 hypothetical protein [Chitinophagaceae bacterium]